MKLLVMLISPFYLFFQNPLEDEANYKTQKRAKRSTSRTLVLKTKQPKSYKMNKDSTVVEVEVFNKTFNSKNVKGSNYKMPNN